MPAPEQRLCLVLQPVRSKKENYCILNNDDREGGINSIPLVSLSGPGFVIQYLSIGKHWAARCFFVIQWNLYHGSFEKNLLKYQPYPTEYLQHCRPGKKRYVYFALEFCTTVLNEFFIKSAYSARNPCKFWRHEKTMTWGLPPFKPFYSEFWLLSVFILGMSFPVPFYPRKAWDVDARITTLSNTRLMIIKQMQSRFLKSN